MSASALSVVALVVATGFGVHSWRDSASPTPTPGTTFGNPLASSTSDAPASPPASSINGLTPQSPAPVSIPAAQPSGSPSASVHPTPKPTPKLAADGQVNPKTTIQLSTTHALLGQQIVATVTILNASPYIYPAGNLGIGSEIPADTFDNAPAGCVLANGGAECSVAELRPGQHLVLAFRITLGWAPGSIGEDEIFGAFDYTDSHGQDQQAPQFSAKVTVDNGTASDAPPSSGTPSSPPASPPSSSASSSTPSPSPSPTASSAPPSSPAPTLH